MADKYTVGLYTLGCKVSQYETEAIREAFVDAGFESRPFEEKNDVYVINTCTVTQESDRKSRQIIRRAIKANPEAIIAVVGCYTQRSPDQVSAIDSVDIILGTDKKMSVIPLALELLREGRGKKTVSVTDVSVADFEPMSIRTAPRTRAYLKIEDGCESKCTYCAISSARGRVRSKPREVVIKEVESLTKSGIKEIVLTGIETGSYGRDFDTGYRLADLIAELDERRSAERIRLGSLAPELVGEDFVERIKGVKILAPHFHISMQSGSDRILASMKRRYTSARAIENIERLRAAFPGASFTTDLMVGFPGETEEDFLLTADFVKRVRFLDAHVFAYSKRSGTPAAEYPNQVDEATKRERSERLIKIKNSVRDIVLDELVARGDELSVIAETLGDDGYYTGHSDTYVEVKFSPNGEGELHGELVNVAPVSHKNGVVLCKLI
ncbi:MAG: tRNA (N(6)-L-threonylcarbamoyladenosine(37)-C(2))-methylthiotransferase MtaB [Clostridia bacterium]|nr:tRNA (N(6)-L-threonylcarbamoyladenosine(37)-C(2))-methylthiotransferase MtaB [Clostridia bacterium]